MAFIKIFMKVYQNFNESSSKYSRELTVLSHTAVFKMIYFLKFIVLYKMINLCYLFKYLGLRERKNPLCQY